VVLRKGNGLLRARSLDPDQLIGDLLMQERVERPSPSAQIQRSPQNDASGTAVKY
jgi:hypothetical protein